MGNYVMLYKVEGDEIVAKRLFHMSQEYAISPTIERSFGYDLRPQAWSSCCDKRCGTPVALSRQVGREVAFLHKSKRSKEYWLCATFNN